MTLKAHLEQAIEPEKLEPQIVESLWKAAVDCLGDRRRHRAVLHQHCRERLVAFSESLALPRQVQLHLDQRKDLCVAVVHEAEAHLCSVYIGRQTQPHWIRRD